MRSSAGRSAGDLVGPQLAADADWMRCRAARPLGGRPVPVAERRGAHPRLEGVLVPPPGDDQPGGSFVGRLEQLEALEAVLVVDCAGPGGEPAGELVPAVGGYRDRVDPHYRHQVNVPTSARHGGPRTSDEAG